MNFYVIACLPSVIGIKLLLHFNNEKSLLKTILNYLIIVFLSNFLLISLIIIINKFNQNIIEYSNNNIIFCVKYVTILSIINVILAFLFSILKKYFDLIIEVTNEKNKKNNM